MKETLLYLRELNNYSQNFVASYLNISRQMYSKYENGDVDPGVKSVIALCKLYKVSYDVILENKFNNTAESEKQNSFSYRIKQEFGRDLEVATPAPVYSANRENNNYYYQKMLSYLPHLTYTQALDMLQKLARKIEVQGQKNRPYTEAANLSDKEARDLFEYFSGKGEGLDYDSEKSSYLRKKHLGER